MQKQEQPIVASTRPSIIQQLHVQEEKQSSAHSAVVAQHDPSVQLSCRMGDASCAGAHASTVNRATNKQPAQATDSLLRLQRQYGNRFVQRVVDISRQEEGDGGVSSEVEQAIQSERGGGQPLASGVQAQMESAMGADFSGVRVHSNAQADNLNQSLSARAFTTGQDVFFKQGEYNPGSSSGRELIAHELTHVVQQNGAVQRDENAIQTKLTLGQPGDQYEQEADQVAQQVVQQETQAAQADGGGQVVNRAGMPEEEEMQMKPDALQRQGEYDEDEMQMKSEGVQRQDDLEDDELMQGKLQMKRNGVSKSVQR